MALYADIEQILSDLENTSLEVQSCHYVHVTYIISPYDFYVRKTDFLPFIEKLESSKPLAKCSKFNIHDLVIININDSNEAEKYGRGKIIQIREDRESLKCDIFLIDYGYIKNSVPAENIWEYNQELRHLPELILLCKLGNCSPIGGGTGWPKKSIDAFKCYVGTECAKMKILEKLTFQLVVELRNTAPDDIATLMALTGYSTLDGKVNNEK